MKRVPWLLWGSPRRALVSTLVAAIGVLLAFVYFPFVRDLAAYGAVPAGAIAFLIKQYPNDAKVLWGQTLEKAAWLNQSVEREAVRQRVEGSLASGVKEIAGPCPAAATAAVKLEFIKSGEQVDELPDGTLVLAIAHHSSHATNLAMAAWAYARHGVLRHSRQHLDRDLSKGIDFIVTRQILGGEHRAAFTYFIEEIWRPAIADAERLKSLCSQLEALQNDELFGPVLLAELADLGVQKANELPNEGIAEETARFVEFLFDISQREHGQGGPLEFEGQVIRASFIIVARADLYAVKGPNPYRKAVEISMERGFRSVYLLGRGKHAEYALAVAESFGDDARVIEPAVWQAQIRQGYRLIPRVVVRILVDVRYEVGIGQRMIYRVGPAKRAAGN